MQWGETPLHVAAMNAQAAVVELLLDRGASVDAVNEVGQHTAFVSDAALMVPFCKVHRRPTKSSEPPNWFIDLWQHGTSHPLDVCSWWCLPKALDTFP